jgi:DNA-binding protein HU-beta
MNKDEMVEGIIRASGISKANVNRFYDGLVALAMKKLSSDGQFVLPGLGVLRVKIRKAREGRNPRTGEKIRIPRKKVVRFGAYKDLKEMINPDAASSRPTEEPEPQEPDPKEGGES